MVTVNGGCLSDESYALLAVLLNVLLRAGKDQIDFEVGERVTVRVVNGSAAGHVPVIDIVGPEILEGTEAAGDRCQVAY